MEFYITMFDSTHADGDNKPHFKGIATINEVEHEFALWPKTFKSGKKGYSGKMKPKATLDEQAAAVYKKVGEVLAKPTSGIEGDRIPF